MRDSACDLAVVGLGVMGANLARNFASRGHRVAIFNRTAEVTRRLVADYPEANFTPCESYEALVVLQLMKPGDKWVVVLPPNLAYGESGAGGLIGPNEVLIFEIELLEVKVSGN